MWRSLRITARFTASDVALLADVPVTTARKFLVQLWQYGYLQADRANGKSERIWRFVRNTGPRAPYMVRALFNQQRCLYDPNTGMHHYAPVPINVGVSDPSFVTVEAQHATAVREAA